MALQLNVSNSLEELSVQLNQQFKKRKLTVFQPYYVVTQTEGMNNWLKLQVAADEEIKIAANIRFLKPNDLLHKVYGFLGGAYTSTYAAGNLCWLLFKILGESDFINKFSAIAAYYKDGEESNGIKQMALAEKLSDLFDQYQIYRPELISGWNKIGLQTVGDDGWQPYIWIRAKQLAGEKFLDKTRLGADILAMLQHPENVQELQRQLPEVHVFGISILTAYHVELFKKLSVHIDIHFYFLNPAPLQYWYDTVNEKQQAVLLHKGVAKPQELTVGNVLLTGWGKVIKDTFCLLFEHDEFLNGFMEAGVNEPASDSLLKKIQQDIFHNRSTSQRPMLGQSEINDGSVTIHSCYTIAREVESLYNYLVHLVDRQKEKLSPRDIVVMVTDVDAYAPYIKAVFENAPYRFHYTIVDESYINSDNIIHALKMILELNEESFKAENIVQLLDSSSIRKRFGLSNISLIRKVVDMANIRFGIDGNKENDTVYVSWRYGLQRIVYGVCMSGEEEYAIDGDTIFPLDIAEGSDAKELVRFAHFVQLLMDTIEKRKAVRTITEWVEYVKSVVQSLVYEPADAVEDDYQMLLRQLQAFAALGNTVTERFSYEVFCYQFIQTLSSNTRSGSFVGGGITFCSLIPMRSIPFKVIALLGLNFDKFPRKETAASFNLIQQYWKRGDRNVKDNDKHLFLETVLSAKEYLYVSYLGQSVKDNSFLPPSAVVDELLDYIDARYEGSEDVRELMVVRQPLHSFSSRYALDSDRLYNYLIEKGSEDIQFIVPDKQPEPVKIKEISLRSLIAFFKHPFKTYYNHVLHIRYDEDTDLLSETELFALDNLQKWSLKQDLLTLSEQEREGYKLRLVKQGQLPLKNMAEITLQDIEIAVSPVKEIFQNITAGTEPSTVPVQLTINNIQITGTIQHVYNDQLVFVCFSKDDYEYQLEACIQYLAGRAMGALDGLHFISTQKANVYPAAQVSKEEAMQRLQTLVQLYQQGHSSLIAFWPDFKIQPDKVAQLDMKGFQDVVRDKIHNYRFPCTDKYILKEYYDGFFNGQDAFEDFKANCEILLTPLTSMFPTYYQ
ncbi:exodeoxyribonuclease V subunit gamma [Niastella yeongjuensis]|uniref:RecBCD enzyme subunit RecC n=1 Tax=Niastella yeongjuensis TaxID=354355 RepID=A0A1V9ET14_9BACT|nr:exodeoxyribonuclease V subunit gamma [Niastella yeongjuensis]OQP49288.1 exodeoxyribonuclease V subunit gamma [Niastella yeongjuensis]SEP43013.1 DNA helicase/exodeoxyribonuclease V, gamma subunit [Niastella yeongjuensis]